MNDTDKTKFGPGVDERGIVNYHLQPRQEAYGKPPTGLRNWDCTVDGHSIPDAFGKCTKCHAVLEVQEKVENPAPPPEPEVDPVVEPALTPAEELEQDHNS